MNAMQEKQREWLLLLVSTGKQSVLTEMAKKLNKSTYDKIKSEFTTSKKEGFDRCFELRIPETGKADVVSKRAFDDLLVRMKKCVGRTLSQHVTFYKEEVSKLYEMRHTPGWNYCNFFVTKVCMGALVPVLDFLILPFRKHWPSHTNGRGSMTKPSNCTESWRTSSQN